MAYNTTIGQTSHAENVTPSDTTVRTYAYLQVGTGGTVAVKPKGNYTTTVTFTVQDGDYIWLMTSQVLATGTSASDIVGFLPI